MQTADKVANPSGSATFLFISEATKGSGCEADIYFWPSVYEIETQAANQRQTRKRLVSMSKGDGVTWDYVIANWEYNSCAGTPYMPYYITDIRENGWNWQIFTRKGSIPYSISTHTDTEHASYYFE